MTALGPSTIVSPNSLAVIPSAARPVLVHWHSMVFSRKSSADRRPCMNCSMNVGSDISDSLCESLPGQRLVPLLDLPSDDGKKRSTDEARGRRSGQPPAGLHVRRNDAPAADEV